jgi:hypothetical protein
MYHKLVNKIEGDSYSRLLKTIEELGYEVQHHDKAVMTDRDLADAWDVYHDEGAEKAVDLLETMYGFLFVRSER